MKFRTLLELGRVSNLPTVWTNVLAGAGLSGAPLTPAPLAAVACAASLFYTGGMLLNDVFDAGIDARERPERPIPSGRAARNEVLALGFGMLGAALALLAVSVALNVTRGGWKLVLAGVGTAAAIVVYDRWHKGFAWSPVVMGFCRAGVYALGAFAVSDSLGGAVLAGATALLLYVVGLTHVARFENASVVARIWPALFLFAPAALTLSWLLPDFPAIDPISVAALLLSAAWTLNALGLALRGGREIGRAVVSLIAGIALVDASLAAARGASEVAVVAFLAFGLTLGAQRWVRGS